MTPEEIIEKLGKPNACCKMHGLDPILIGDVLEKIEPRRRLHIKVITELWQPCGFTRSLQEIAGDVKICNATACPGEKAFNDCPNNGLMPDSQALFTFIAEIL